MAGFGGKTSTSGQGRPKGVPNKVTRYREAEIAASGLTPLDWMLKVLRDESQPAERRDDMAKAAAPYVHPRLASVVHKGDEDHPLWIGEQVDLTIFSANQREALRDLANALLERRGQAQIEGDEG